VTATDEPGLSAGAFREFAYGDDANPHGWPSDPAEEFHVASQYTRATASRVGGPAAQYFLTVPDAHRLVGVPRLTSSGLGLALRAPQALPIDLRDTVHRRRSRLPDEAAPVSIEQLGQLFGLACGARPDDSRARVVPSAGSLHPLEVILVCSEVDGLSDGAYLYDSIEHRLRAVPGLSPFEFWSRARIRGPERAPSVVAVIAATFARSRAKYGLRGYRFALLEAGHVGQAIVLTATAMGLSSLPLGGFVDTEVDRMLGLDGVDRSVLYLVCVSGAELPGASTPAPDGRTP
jgi:SagB-type dehydrogenase family enzyme